MNILGLKFGADRKPLMVQEVNIPELDNKFFGFSTPFMKIGKGNLSLPRVDKWARINGSVKFGYDNLYPQLLDQMYYTSAIHGAIIEFTTNAVINGGYIWNMEPKTGLDKVELKTFEKINDFEKMARLLTRDYIMHRRVNVMVIKDEFGDFVKFKRMNPASIRNRACLSTFDWCYDWRTGSGIKSYDRYSYGIKNLESLYVYQDETPGQDIYPIPNYNSILNWCALDGEIAYLQKNNIMNAVFPSAVISVPYKFKSIEEAEAWKESVGLGQGAERAGKAWVMQGEGFEMVPKMEAFQVNSNDKAFEVVSKDLREYICQAWSINPSIMGIKTPGSLGNTQEIEVSYDIFNENVVINFKKVMNKILNDLIDISGIKNSISINDYRIVKVSTEGGNFEESENLELEVDPEDEKIVNDALRGLSAAENSDIYRIIRDYNKGRLNQTLAITRLKSYGLSENECKSILDIK